MAYEPRGGNQHGLQPRHPAPTRWGRPVAKNNFYLVLSFMEFRVK